MAFLNNMLPVVPEMRFGAKNSAIRLFWLINKLFRVWFN